MGHWQASHNRYETSTTWHASDVKYQNCLVYQGISCRSFRKFRENSGTQMYLGTKLGLIRLPW